MSNWMQAQADAVRGMGLDPDQVYGVELLMWADKPPRVVVTMAAGFDVRGVNWKELLGASEVMVFVNEEPWEGGG